MSVQAPDTDPRGRSQRVERLEQYRDLLTAEFRVTREMSRLDLEDAVARRGGTDEFALIRDQIRSSMRDIEAEFDANDYRALYRSLT